MLGRFTALNQIVEEYGEIEVTFEDLRDIPELVEIYNTSGKNQIIVYRIIL